jgi:hypothetical protein
VSEAGSTPRRLAATGATAHDRPSEAGHPENPGSEGQLSERYSSPHRSGAPSNPQSSPDSINFLTTSSGPILGATALGLTMPLTLRCLWALSIRSEIPTYHREVGEKLTR